MSKKDKKKAMADLAIDPTIRGAYSISYFSHDFLEEMGLTELQENLKNAINKIKDSDDLSEVEALLATQAVTLDVLFHKLAMMGMQKEHLEQFKSILNLAFKAQNQSRMTMATLAEIKNPQPYIQNNRAEYQQVNNGVKPSRAGEKPKSSNELLTDGRNDYETVDFGRAEETGGEDQEMEAVAVQHRPED